MPSGASYLPVILNVIVVLTVAGLYASVAGLQQMCRDIQKELNEEIDSILKKK